MAGGDVRQGIVQALFHGGRQWRGIEGGGLLGVFIFPCGLGQFRPQYAVARGNDLGGAASDQAKAVAGPTDQSGGLHLDPYVQIETILRWRHITDEIDVFECALGELPQLTDITVKNPFAQILGPFGGHGRAEHALGPADNAAVGLQLVFRHISRLAIQFGQQAAVGQQGPEPRQGSLVMEGVFHDDQGHGASASMHAGDGARHGDQAGQQ